MITKAKMRYLACASWICSLLLGLAGFTGCCRDSGPVVKYGIVPLYGPVQLEEIQEDANRDTGTDSGITERG